MVDFAASRTVAKFETFGFIKSRTTKRITVITTPIHKVRVDTNPFAQVDRVEFA